MKRNLVVILTIVFLISNLALSTLIISLSNRAQRQRTTTLQQQEVILGYLNCIFLAKFDYPEAVSPNATREQVENALDKCSKVGKK